MRPKDHDKKLTNSQMETALRHLMTTKPVKKTAKDEVPKP